MCKVSGKSRKRRDTMNVSREPGGLFGLFVGVQCGNEVNSLSV